MFIKLLYPSYRRTARQRAKHLTPGGQLLVAVLFASVLIGIDTTRTLLYQVAAFSFVLLLIALVWSLFFRLRLSVTRVLPQFGTAGEPLEYRLHITNRSSQAQKGLSVLEQTETSYPSAEEFMNTPEPGEGERNMFDRTFLVYRWRWLVKRKRQATPREQAIPALPAKATREIPQELLPLRRGVLHFTGMTVMRPDPFCLYKAFRHIPLPNKVLILPKRYELPDFPLPGTRKFKLGGVTLASSIGDSEEFVSLRDYRPGDPLRRIHWKSWAKTGKPIVKEYQDEYFVRHALVLDTFQQAAVSDVFEEAVSLAASFAYTVRTQDSLLDLMFIGPEAYCFTIGRSLAHTEHILEILASVEVCSDKPFNVLAPMILERAAMLSGCICIFLAWDEERQQLIRQLRSLDLPLTVFVISGSENQERIIYEQAQDTTGDIHFLDVGNMQEDLWRL